MGRFRVTKTKIPYGNTGTKQLDTWQLGRTDSGTKEMVQYIWSEADEGNGDKCTGGLGRSGVLGLEGEELLQGKREWLDEGVR